MGDPLSEYERRLAARRESVKELEARDNRLANERLGVFVAGCVIAYLIYRFGGGAAWFLIALPVVYFGVLMVRHERTLRALRNAKGGVRFYQFGIARIADTWKGQGSSGNGLFPDDHPYAADLDLYGEGSIFELLCTARTRAGEQRLADWLAVGADPVTVRRRQEAIDELRGRLDLREQLALYGDETRAKVHPRDLIAWADEKPLLPKGLVRPIATVVGILGLLSLLAIPLIGFAGVILVGLCAGVIFARYRGTIHTIAGMIDQPARELELIAHVIGRLETETFESDLLAQLQKELRLEPFAASEAIAKLHRLVLWMESLGNQLFAPVAFLLVLPLQFAYRLEDWRALHGPNIPRWLDALGELEALVALSAYAYEHPDDPFPELVEDERIFDGEALGHPLLPETECVRNDARLDDDTQLIIVSGSNMSGKSTYLRAIGINVVLAQAGAPVRAKRLRLSPFSLGATLRIQDSIHLGRSRFYAEIEKLGRLATLGTSERPLLFLLDELLHGTNSHDRAVGGEAVLKQFVGSGGVGLVTTHDVALTGIEPEFGGNAKNVHFRDEVIEGELHFDYKLQPGPVQKGNALALMRAVGLDV